MDDAGLQQFYIPEDQSVYLLSEEDARKLKAWVALCCQQLQQLGYVDIELIGKGAFGFVFAGRATDGRSLVFKFSRITLPQRVQDRLEDEAFMLSQVQHPRVPAFVGFQRIRRQSILVMTRAPGENLEQWSLREGPLSPRLLLRIASQLVDILQTLRQPAVSGEQRGVIVHGDIKPSNLMFDAVNESVMLIDWGSAVLAQLDSNGQPLATGLAFLSDDLQQSNARLGDVYFIGEQQRRGALSSPRFDEQGLAGTLYALASGQSCRFGHRAIPPTALGLPREFARVLEAMLGEEEKQRNQAGDYLLRNMPAMSRMLLLDLPEPAPVPLIPVWLHPGADAAAPDMAMETVSYSSRTAFLRQSFLSKNAEDSDIASLDEVQLDRYYRQFLQGMGDTEKAFLAAISRLAKYPLVGGLVVRWQPEGVYIDSSLNLHDPQLKSACIRTVNTLVNLARAICRQGVFKSCLFNARQTLHIDRADTQQPFLPPAGMQIPYECQLVPETDDRRRVHSYFEDGRDPEESLELPASIMTALQRLNGIHHTGLVIFESLPTHLKIHNAYCLLDASEEEAFRECLDTMLAAVADIKGLGVAGFMKLPYKDTRFFSYQERLPVQYYPSNPRRYMAESGSATASATVRSPADNS